MEVDNHVHLQEPVIADAFGFLTVNPCLIPGRGVLLLIRGGVLRTLGMGHNFALLDPGDLEVARHLGYSERCV